ncbi:hypothetical protein GV827_15880 [Sulfitobacter sp. JBTF-M27]|uniref:Uncharacterized protein n=1 Tax=Sulfitobacter sediminilitoris TaxID=2698830 RepID=A0A6P0CFK2_9RHOB|nr:hypothetical protein [Sulfitobacter sediminilitoris]NEK23875.1 hypothetical protein [Sulfitobacter sediminilitoris]
MTQRNNTRAIAALRDLLGARLSTGESIREIHGRDEAGLIAPIVGHVGTAISTC